MVENNKSTLSLSSKFLKFKRTKKKEALILLILLLINFIVVLMKISFSKLEWSPETCILYTIAKELENGKVYNLRSIIPSYKYLSNISFILLNISLYKIFHSFLHSSVALSILITSSIVIVNYIFLKKFFNFKTALIGSILFFSTEWGSLFLYQPWIYLTAFFCLLTLVVAYYLYFEKRDCFTHFLLGILAGISFSFHPLGIFILIFSFLIQFKTIRFNSIGLKKFLIFSSALLIIFIPFLVFTDIKSFYISILTKEGVEGLSGAFVGRGLVKIPENIFKMMVQVFPPLFLLPFIYLSLENIIRFTKRKELDKEFLLLIYTWGFFLFGLFTYIRYVYIFAFLTIPTIALSAIFLGKFVKYKKYGMIFAIIFVIFIFLYDLYNFPFNFSPTPQFYKECYDVLGYSIANTYHGDIDGFTRECDKLEENRYYCYKGLGKVIGRGATSLNNLTLSKCNEVEFNRWCEEGLLEELSFRPLGNLSLENELDVYYYEEGKWSNIDFKTDEFRQKFVDLKINLSVCEEFPNKELCYENLPWVYLVIKENLMMKEKTGPYLLKELASMRECNDLEEPYRAHCYVGWFKKINPESFPYIGNLDTCYLWEGECKYACFLSLSMKINFRFPDVKAAERVCEIVGGEDEIFKKICYSAIGFSSANRFYYNTFKAFEECTKIKENREDCFSGVSYFIEENNYYQILHNIVREEELGTCKMRGLWHLIEVSDFYLKDLNLTDTTIHIEDSSNVYLKNLTLYNSTVRVDRSSEVHLDDSRLINSSVVIQGSSNSSVSGVTLSNSNVLIDRSSEVHLDDSKLKNSSVMVYNSLGISLENSKIENSSFLAHESSIAFYEVSLGNTNIRLDRSSDSSIRNLSLFNTSLKLDRVSNITLSDMKLNSASFRIDGSSDVTVEDSNLVNTNFTVLRTSDIHLNNLSFADTSVRLDRSSDSSIRNLSLFNTSIEMLSSLDVSLENSEIENSNLLAHDSSIDLYEVKLSNTTFNIYQSEGPHLNNLVLSDTTIHIEDSSNVYLKNLTLYNSTVRVDRSSEVHLDDSIFSDMNFVIDQSSKLNINSVSLNGGNLVIDRSSEVDLNSMVLIDTGVTTVSSSKLYSKNLTFINVPANINSSMEFHLNGLALSNSNVLIDRSSEVHLDDSKLKNSSVMVYNSLGISLENSKIENSSFLAHESSIAFYNTNITDAGIRLDRSSDSSIRNLSLFNTSLKLDRVSNITLSDMKLNSASLQIDDSSDISITKSVIKDYPWVEEHYYRLSKENGIQISNSKNVLLHSSTISNFNVNVFIENSKNISIENSTLNNANFRNFYGRCVSNLNIDNSIFNNASNDKSIDFSDCYSQNVVIKNSKISDSQKGIRLNNIENITIENNEISNCEVGVRIDKNVSLVNIRNNFMNSPERVCISMYKDSIPEVKLENNTMNCRTDIIED